MRKGQKIKTKAYKNIIKIKSVKEHRQCNNKNCILNAVIEIELNNKLHGLCIKCISKLCSNLKKRNNNFIQTEVKKWQNLKQKQKIKKE